MIQLTQDQKETSSFFFFPLLIVTFSNLMDSRGRTDGDNGVLSMKMLRDFRKPGSAKEGEWTGLRRGESEVGVPEITRGGEVLFGERWDRGDDFRNM